MEALAAALALGYLAGSVPFGVVLTRLTGYGDIRSIGSGNIGATNVLRTGNRALALFTLLLDAGKGALAALIAAPWLGQEASLLAGVAAVVGHNFPIWLRFRGGKGVATTLGVLLAIAWPVGLAACAIWLLLAWLARISSVAALGALLAGPFCAWALGASGAVIGAVSALTVLGWLRHHDNIRRLLKGEEPRIRGSS